MKTFETTTLEELLKMRGSIADIKTDTDQAVYWLYEALIIAKEGLSTNSMTLPIQFAISKLEQL